MYNDIKLTLKITLLFSFILLSFTSKAQEKHRVFNFKIGNEFQREVLSNSKAVVQRGNQTLTVNTTSSLTKLYKVTTADDKGYGLNVTIKKMDNLIDALGKQFHYNSEVKGDSTSKIEKALNFMLNKPVDIAIDKYGVLLSSTEYKSELATDTLISFAGIQMETFEKGALLGLLADMNINSTYKKGYAWTDSVQINKQKLVTKFWIEDINEKNTIIKFSSSIFTTLLNSNSNGTYVLDNATGIIAEKLVYTVSTGYQVSSGGISYAVSRSTSLSEKNKQIR
ncbi:hypothetical protein GM921_09435 [Pedobacter sp. LMG 31464]|uniref:Uncharacterized protein n=1 Tax=Pedobacter planticolens TaxID=2679964 RepID=A0A923IWY3_9SPHI|nr:hypothetical protein [Pedobacter planticolens]MBB2145707.1 hypothetical protein [Pedobacter planticolens]